MVYDHAYQLARSIRNSEEYKKFVHLQNKVNMDSQARNMLRDFRKKQLELQMRQFSGKSVEQQELEQMNGLIELIGLHNDIKQLLEAERRLGLMMDDIQRIISEPITSLIMDEEEA